jgi:nucleotidyltransferase/DNA polymerase involved in DNA repair
MPALRAQRLCPDAALILHNFIRYKAVSRAVREILERHTDLIGPLSLDEAYLEVTESKGGPPHRHACGEDDSAADPRRVAPHCIRRNAPQQGHGKDCFGLAQTRWPVRHSAKRGERLPRFPADRPQY